MMKAFASIVFLLLASYAGTATATCIPRFDIDASEQMTNNIRNDMNDALDECSRRRRRNLRIEKHRKLPDCPALW